MAALAALVERAIAGGQPRETMEAALDALAPPLAALVRALECALPTGTEPAPVAVDATGLRAVCAALDALLADDDSRAADAYAEHAGLLRAAFPGHHAGIDRAMRSFDFEAARVALAQAVAASG